MLAALWRVLAASALALFATACTEGKSSDQGTVADGEPTGAGETAEPSVPNVPGEPSPEPETPSSEPEAPSSDDDQVPSDDDGAGDNDVASADDDDGVGLDDDAPTDDVSDDDMPDEDVVAPDDDTSSDDTDVGDDMTDGGPPAPTVTPEPSTPSPSPSSGVVPPTTVSTPPFPWALPAAENCEEPTLSVSPPANCYASQVCGEERIAASCTRTEAANSFDCECTGRSHVRRFEALEANADNACGSVLEACKSAELDVDPELECNSQFTETIGLHCTTGFTCDHAIYDANGVTLVEDRGGSSLCNPPDSDAPGSPVQCNCSYGWGSVGFTAPAAEAEATCASAFEVCASSTPPPLPEELDCTELENTVSDFACDYSLLCKASGDLGEGRELTYSQVPSARCTRLREENDWSCDCGWGERLALQVSGETPSDLACVTAINVCVAKTEPEFTGPVSCENVDQCAQGLFCVQPAMVDGISFGVETAVALRCDELELGRFRCTCQALSTSVEIAVEADDQRSACPLGAAACEQAIADEANVSSQ